MSVKFFLNKNKNIQMEIFKNIASLEKKHTNFKLRLS